MKASTYWKMLLAVAVAVSVAGNTGHAFLAENPHRWAAAAWAAVPPLMLFAVTHGLANTVGGVGGHRRWVWRAGVAGAAMIAAGAFWASYVALRDLSAILGCPPSVAVVMPLIVDAATAVSSVMALAVKPAVTSTLVPTAKAEKPRKSGDMGTTTGAKATTEMADAAAVDIGAVADRPPMNSGNVLAASGDHSTGAVTSAPVLHLVDQARREVATGRRRQNSQADDHHVAVAEALLAARRVRGHLPAVAAAVRAATTDPQPSQRATAAATGLGRSTVKRVYEAAGSSTIWGT